MSRFKVRWEEKIANIIKQEQDSIKTWDLEKTKNPIANARVVSGLEYPPNGSRFPMMRVKKYEIIYNGKQIWRSYKDFNILRGTLMENFPGAFIQPLPKIRSKSAMSLFFNSIVFNPFFNSDEAVEKFVDFKLENFASEMRIYKKQKKIGKVKLSLGIKAWMHYLSIHGNGVGEDYESQKEFFNSLRADLIMFGRSIKTLQAKVRSLMSMQEGQALFNSELSGVLQAVMSTELNSKNLTQMTVETKSAAARLTEAARRTAKAFHEHTSLLTREYGAPTIQKKLIDPMEAQAKIVSYWISLISAAEAEIKVFHAAESKIASENNANSKMKLIRKQADLEKRLSIKFCGLFGMELERYKIYRENSMELVLRELSNFHCVGALRLFDIWKLHDPHRINLDRYDYSECFANNRDIQRKEKQIMKNMSEDGEFELHSLVVNTNAKVRRIPGRKALPLKPGAYLVGRKVRHPKTNEMLWYATDTYGKRGYIEMKNVTEDKTLPIDPNASIRLKTPSMISGEDSSNPESSRLTLISQSDENISSNPPPIPTFKSVVSSAPPKSVPKAPPAVKVVEKSNEKPQTNSVEKPTAPALPKPIILPAPPTVQRPEAQTPAIPNVRGSVAKNHQIAAVGKLSEVKAKTQPLDDIEITRPPMPQMPKMNMNLLAAINNAKKDNVLKPAVVIEQKPLPPKATVFVNPLMAEMQKKLLSRRKHIEQDHEDEDGSDDEKFL